MGKHWSRGWQHNINGNGQWHTASTSCGAEAWHSVGTLLASNATSRDSRSSSWYFRAGVVETVASTQNSGRVGVGRSYDGIGSDSFSLVSRVNRNGAMPIQRSRIELHREARLDVGFEEACQLAMVLAETRWERCAMSEGLGKQALRGGAALASAKILCRKLDFIRMLTIARWLGPEELTLIGGNGMLPTQSPSLVPNTRVP